MTQKYKAVYIEWLDSCLPPGWNDLDILKISDYKYIKSIGWEIIKTKKYITISAGITDNPEQACGIITIPICSIISIKYLKEIK